MDFGEKGNKIHYNQKTPPFYNSENLMDFTIPKLFYIGSCDAFVNDQDFLFTKNNLPEKSSTYKVHLLLYSN